MSLFPVFNTSSSGLQANRVWMDAVSDNIANMNTARPMNQSAFQARYVLVNSVRGEGNDPAGVGGGVEIAGVEFGDPTGVVRYEPGHPLADANGLVRYPDIDLGDQMTQLIQAQRSYQLNLSVIDRAKESYQQAINIAAR